MKKIFLSLLVPSACLFAQSILPSSLGFPGSTFSKSEKLSRILVENRVLTRVNSQAISVIDVMKKMDMDFYIDFPHLMDSEVARYQFYRARWKAQLERMVESELILEDAKSHKIEVTKGDTREEIESRYGPEVIVNLDKIGLTYDEAWEVVEKDILVQRMTQGHLYLRGVMNISPEDLLKAYQEHIQTNRKPDFWKYYMISFTGPNALEDAQMAQDLLLKLQSQSKNFKSLSIRFENEFQDFANKKITISNPFQLSSEQVSESHRELLSSMTPETFSAPFKETSRATQKPVYRIFFLEEFTPGGKVELAEVEDKLIMKLKQNRIEEEYLAYVTMLKERYGITSQSIFDSIPSDFEPFTLK